MTVQPKHVAFLLNDLALGGAERVMITLCNALAARGIRVELLVSKMQGPLLGAVSDKVEVTLLPASGRSRWMPALARVAIESPETSLHLLEAKPPSFVRRLPALRDYLQAQRPDALLSTLRGNNILALWAAHSAKVETRIVLRVATTVSVDAQHDAQFLSGPLPRQLRRWYPCADSVVCVSKGVEDDLKSFLGHPLKSVRTIYNPLDLEAIAAAGRECPDHPWLKASGDDCIVALGRLEPPKDYEILLRALARLNAERPAHLIILGEGSEMGKLSALADELGIADRIDLHGAVENPFPFLARADLYVLSSAWEGCPNALMEAMASGCRVVSTDCPSGPRELLQDGAIGHLAPVGDVEALASAMASALATPPAPERIKARAAHYALPTVVERYLEVLLPDRNADCESAA